MKLQRSLRLMVGLSLAMLLLIACGAPAEPPVPPTSTPIPPTATPTPLLVKPENPIGIGGYWKSMEGQVFTVLLSDTEGRQATLEVEGELSWDSEGRLTEGEESTFRIQTDADPEHWHKVVGAKTLDGLLVLTAEDGIYTYFTEGSSETSATGSTLEATVTGDGSWQGQATFIITGFDPMNFTATIYQDTSSYRVQRSDATPMPPAATAALKPQSGAILIGNLESEQAEGSGTISLTISADGTSISQLDIAVTDSVATCSDGSTGTLGFGQFSLPMSGPFLIEENNFEVVISENGRLEGKFISPTEASGSLDLIVDLDLLGSRQTCDFGTWTWSAEQKQLSRAATAAPMLSTATPLPPTVTLVPTTPVPTRTPHPTPTWTPTVVPAGLLVQSKDLGEGQVTGVAWSPNGQMLAVSFSDGVHIYEAKTLTERLHIRTDGIMMSVAWSPNGELVTAAGSGGVFFWNITGKLIEQPVSGDFFWGIAWSPDGKLAASGTPLVVIWDVNGQAHQLDGHEATVLGLAWSPDGKRLASSGNDAMAIIWDGKSKKVLHRLTLDDVTSTRLFGVSTVAWSPDGRYLAGNGSALLIWDAKSGEISQVLSTSEKPGTAGEWSPGTGVAWSPDGTRLASAHSDGQILLWDVANWELLGTLHHSASSGLQSSLGFTVTWSPNGTQLASGGLDGTVKLWDMNTSEAASRPSRPTSTPTLPRPRLLPTTPAGPGASGGQTGQPVPFQVITCPTQGVAITAITASGRGWWNINGTADIPNLDYWKGEISADGQSWTVLYRSSNSVRDGLLIEFNTGTVPRGTYQIRLLAVDRTGNYPEPCIIQISTK